MLEQDSQYHPAVEKLMETSGPNIGRIKNKDLAHREANSENSLRAKGFDPEMLNGRIDNDLQYRVANQAVADSDLANIITYDAELAHRGKPLRTQSMEERYMLYNEAQRDADEAIDSLDALQETSKPLNREHEDALRAQMQETARKKIEETDSSKS